MNEENRKLLFEKVHACPHCNGKMNDWFRGNHHGVYFHEKLGDLKSRYFCTKECYENYKSEFIVEIYNDNPIYCVEIDGEKRYMPYFEANYYFSNIDDCKRRMDMKGVAVMNVLWKIS